MRVSIEKHHRERINRLAQQLGTDNPSVAVNYILGLWASGQLSNTLPSSTPTAIPAPAATDDEFAALLDWGTVQ